MQLRGEELSDFRGNCKLFFTKNCKFGYFLSFSAYFSGQVVAFGESLGKIEEEFNNEL